MGGSQELGADARKCWNSREATAAPAEWPVKRIFLGPLLFLHIASCVATRSARALAPLRKPEWTWGEEAEVLVLDGG